MWALKAAPSLLNVRHYWHHDWPRLYRSSENSLHTKHCLGSKSVGMCGFVFQCSQLLFANYVEISKIQTYFKVDWIPSTLFYCDEIHIAFTILTTSKCTVQWHLVQVPSYHHHCPVPEHFITSKGHPVPVNSHSLLLPPPSLWLSLSCFHGLIYAG